MRAAADPTAVRAVIAASPNADEIGIRDNWRQLDTSYLRDAPKIAAKRRAYLAAKFAEHRAALEVEIGRYSHLRDTGLPALTDYDVCISSGGDPLRALRTALGLLSAHISWHLSLMMSLSIALEDADAATDTPRSPQLDLF